MGKADYDIQVSATGEHDSQSYVQIIVDGKPIGSIKYEGKPVTYHLKGLAEGEHTIGDNYSGTSQQKGCTSETITLGTPTALNPITAASTSSISASDTVYNLQGQVLPTPPQHGAYILHGRKLVQR